MFGWMGSKVSCQEITTLSKVNQKEALNDI